MKRILILASLLLLIIVPTAHAEGDTVRAKVLTVQPTSESEIIYTARILEGPYKGHEYTDTFAPMAYTQYDFKLKPGCLLLIDIDDSSGALDISIDNIYRNQHLKILTIIFVAVLLLFGRKMGLVSLLSLIVTGLCIFFIYMPLVLHGFDIIFVTVVCSILIITISFVIIGGLTKKTLSAIIGTFGGVMCAFILIKIFSDVLCITGTTSEDVYLLVYERGVTLNFSDLFISGVMIGTIGVLMDVAMSISSVVFELREHSPSMPFAQLVRSGLNVGKDVMATMVNTLILAYAGTALPLFFWIASSDMGMGYTLGLEEVASEILRALCGSIGLILAVPITSMAASFIACREQRIPISFIK